MRFKLLYIYILARSHRKPDVLFLLLFFNSIFNMRTPLCVILYTRYINRKWKAVAFSSTPQLLHICAYTSTSKCIYSCPQSFRGGGITMRARNKVRKFASEPRSDTSVRARTVCYVFKESKFRARTQRRMPLFALKTNNYFGCAKFWGV